jgi:hypothetical protein
MWNYMAWAVYHEQQWVERVPTGGGDGANCASVFPVAIDREKDSKELFYIE